jgi:hypothetical protein
MATRDMLLRRLTWVAIKLLHLLIRCNTMNVTYRGIDVSVVRSVYVWHWTEILIPGNGYTKKN